MSTALSRAWGGLFGKASKTEGGGAGAASTSPSSIAADGTPPPPTKASKRHSRSQSVPEFELQTFTRPVRSPGSVTGHVHPRDVQPLS